jgi:preprotein translocase subunit SecE
MAVTQKPAPPTTTPNMDASREKAGNFLNETYVELKKTTWPTKEEATRLTLVVVGVIVVLGIYMGILDGVLSFLVNRFSLIK